MRKSLLIAIVFLSGCAYEDYGYIDPGYSDRERYERRVRDLEWEVMRDEQRAQWAELNRHNGW